MLLVSLLVSACPSLLCTPPALTGTPGQETSAVKAPTSSIDWPGWRGPSGTGLSGESAWQDEGRELWRRDVGLGYSQASVVGDRLYTRGFRAEDGVDVTLCLSAETGEELWRHEVPSELLDNMHRGGTLTTPAVQGGLVYVLGRTGPLFALDAETGEERWAMDLAEEFGLERGAFGLCTSPLTLEGRLIVNVGTTASLDPASGEVQWRTKDYGYSYSTPTRFLWKDTELLAVFNGSGLAVLELETGTERALFEWTSGYNVNCATPIVIEDRIFISTGYDDKGCAMLRLTDEGLEPLWQSKAMRNKMNGCVMFDGYLYGFDDKVLKCIDLEGELQWRERGLGLGTIIGAGGRAIVLGEEGELLVAPLSPAGFEVAARSRPLAEGPCWSTPVLSGGRIYVRNQGGLMVCLDHRPE